MMNNNKRYEEVFQYPEYTLHREIYELPKVMPTEEYAVSKVICL